MGYLSVISVEGIYACLSHHQIVPKHIDDPWEGLWNKRVIFYTRTPSEHIEINIYRGYEKCYLEVDSSRKDIIDQAIQIVDQRKLCNHALKWIEDTKLKIHFEQVATDREAVELYRAINLMIQQLGIQKPVKKHHK